jgi:hypothetical protein
MPAESPLWRGSPSDVPLQIGFLNGTGTLRVVIPLPSRPSSLENSREKKPCLVAGRSSLIWPRQHFGSAMDSAFALLVTSFML